MNQLLSALLQILFPRRTDAQLVRTLTPEILHEYYYPRLAANITFLLPFQQTEVRACIHEVKFHENRRAIALLGSILEQYLDTLETDVILIPLPLSAARKKERGFNQTERLAQTIAAHPKVTVSPDILHRVKETKPQTSLSRSDRLRNMQGAFAVYDHPAVAKKISGAHVIVLDDVSTTGATLHAAKAALSLHAPASISLLALAH